MGMFDYVNVEVPCPKCGETVKDFQSKSGPCLLDDLSPEEVTNFYSGCLSCGTWVEFNRECPPPAYPPRTKPYSAQEIVDLGFVLSTRRRWEDPNHE